jgi:FkbM family methyltransferase
MLTTLKVAAVRAVTSLPEPWHLAIRRRYTAYSVRTQAPPDDAVRLVPLIDPGTLVLDAGANIGTYTVAWARLAAQAQIVAFEPIPSTFVLLQHAARDLANVRLLPYAVSDRVGSITMEMPVEDGAPVPALARIHYRTDRPPLAHHWTISTRTLDGLFLPSSTRVSVLKLDVEMHELEALRGAVGLLQRDHPAIYAELQPDFPTKASQRREVLTLLEREGYEAFAWEDHQLVSWTPESPALDALFLTAVQADRLRRHMLDEAAAR